MRFKAFLIFEELLTEALVYLEGQLNTDKIVALVAKAKTGTEREKEWAQADLYNMLKGSIRSIGRSSVSINDLDDLVSYVFMNFIVKDFIDGNENPAEIGPQLSAVVRFKAVDMIREKFGRANKKKDRTKEIPMGVGGGKGDNDDGNPNLDLDQIGNIPAQDDTAGEVERDDLMKTIADLFVKHLSEPHNKILNMFYIQGLTIKEIAQQLGITKTAANTRLYNARISARHSLTPALKQMGIDPETDLDF